MVIISNNWGIFSYSLSVRFEEIGVGMIIEIKRVGGMLGVLIIIYNIKFFPIAKNAGKNYWKNHTTFLSYKKLFGFRATIWKTN